MRVEIGLVKPIMEISPNLHNGVNVEQAVDDSLLTTLRIQEMTILLQRDHVPKRRSEFVFRIKSHGHGSTPSVIIAACRMMRNKTDSWMISIVKKIRTPVVVHLRLIGVGRIQSTKPV